ncbi:hypothetical protein KY363_03655 [Candidatus Woesearchaeota archaeon]|nr:hypothetical protein [Candidatus Woesearchaeota archaeon]
MDRWVLALLIVLLLVLSGCASQVSVRDISETPERYLGREIVVSGRVSIPLNIGAGSGFNLKSDGSSVLVSSDYLPEADANVTVRGVLVKGILTGVFIYAKEVAVD